MIEIIECEQNSPEWYEARRGLPTASEFKTIIAIKKDASEKKTRQTYLDKLAGEIITGEPMSNYVSPDMERGKAMEDEARDMYAFMKDASPERVGFIRNGIKGASPDSLLGVCGGLEIKSAAPHVQIARLRKRDELPYEHKAQVHGNLWVAEREWWDFVSYCPKLPLFVLRVYRDEKYIETIAESVYQFHEELQQTVSYILGLS